MLGSAILTPMKPRPFPAWVHAVSGAVLGLLYAVLDEGVLDAGLTGPAATIAHELLDAVLPVFLGLTTGLGWYYFKRQRRLNARLSIKNEQLKQDLLFHTLLSQILHEIQNPVHNLAAAVELESARLDPAQREMLLRNLDTLKRMKERYGRVVPTLEALDPAEPVDWRPWFDAFFADKLAGQVRSGGVAFTRDQVHARVLVHPVLLEQVLLTLFANALRALESLPAAERSLSLRARLERRGERRLLVARLANRGGFSAEALGAQGRKPVTSGRGLGLGLLLARTLLEQVGGDLLLENRDGQAAAEITLPAEPS